MSFYNEPLQWIHSSIQSILEQTFKDFELIIICDNADNIEGLEYIKGLCKSDSRISLIANDTNLGPTRSFNIAIAAAQGEYIARMDADDIALPERLAKQVEFLDNNPHISVCATDAHIIDDKGNIKRRNRYKHKRETALNVISNCIAHPSVMFRRNLLELRNPLYNENYTYSQDYELWQFLILQGKQFHTLGEVLLLYRKSPKQISKSKKQRQISLFKQAHKSFILNWLIQHNIISNNESNDLKLVLTKASEALKNLHKTQQESHEVRQFLTYIIYVIYFSLGTREGIYKWKYLTDSNLIALRIRFIYSYRLFFSSKRRRDRNTIL